MKKNLHTIFTVFFLLCALQVNAEKISIAPLLYYNEETGKDMTGIHLNRKFAELMKEYWFNGLVSFATTADKTVETVQTTQQAIQVSAAEKCDYLIYGYVRENDASLFAELRVFNPGNQLDSAAPAAALVEKRIFAATARGEREKLLRILAEELYGYFTEKYRLPSEGKPAETKTFAVKIPISAGYWTHAGQNWTQLIIGTFQFHAGTELYPKLDLKPIDNMKNNVSFRLESGYRFGLNNPDKYPGYYHEITIALSVFYNLYLTDNHGLSFGLGPLYGITLSYVRPKYEETALHILNQAGCAFYADYRYTLTPEITLSAGFALDVYFSKKSAPIFATRLGVVYTPYEKKEKQR